MFEQTEIVERPAKWRVEPLGRAVISAEPDLKGDVPHGDDSFGRDQRTQAQTVIHSNGLARFLKRGLP